MTNPANLYLEDLAIGNCYDLGCFTLSEREIIEFAERYDPQPFHTDPAAASESHFGGIIASGWQTTAAVMRLMVDNFIPREASLGSPGIDQIRWLAPVRPDVAYCATYTVVDNQPSRSRSDRGHIVAELELKDPEDNVVMTFTGRGIFLRTPA